MVVCQEKKQRKGFQIVFTAFEIILLLLITGIGWKMRLYVLNMVGTATGQNGISPSASYVKESLSALIFSVFGYKESILGVFHFFFVLAGAVFTWAAVRIVGGRILGVIAYATVLCFPEESYLLMEFNTDSLLICIMMAAVFLFLLITKLEKEENPLTACLLLYFTDGLLFGVACFLHPVSMIVVVFLFFSTLFIHGRKENQPVLYPLFRGIIYLFASCLGFFCLLVFKAKDLGTDFGTVLMPYIRSYMTDIENQIMVPGILIPCVTFSVTAFAGTMIRLFVSANRKKAETKAAQKENVREEVVQEETISEPCAKLPDEKHEKKEIHYLENPLPGPKKHVPKTMDFDINVSDDDDFDI